MGTGAGGPEADPIVVVDWDPAWPHAFQELAEPLRRATQGLGAKVEHVGSTAVDGLAAKPIIDIDVVLRSPASIPEAIARLGRLGYRHQGDHGIPGREAFAWPPWAKRHHLYLVVAGSEPHLNHIAFRDHLRSHPEDAAAYAALKRHLAHSFRHHRAAYTEGKSAFVRGILGA
ncbi:MAG: GrpB family protein [Actinomycetota bacterium]|nr:GrpB family protein [Actinomycetota bacterium]